MRSSLLIVSSLLVLEALATPTPTARLAWPYRIEVRGAAGGAAAFRAVTRDSGGLWVARPGSPGDWPTGRGSVPLVTALAPGDTLRGRAPAEYPAAPARGAVTFLADGSEGLRVTVYRNGGGAPPVSAAGRRLTVRHAGGRVVVEAE